MQSTRCAARVESIVVDALLFPEIDLAPFFVSPHHSVQLCFLISFADFLLRFVSLWKCQLGNRSRNNETFTKLYSSEINPFEIGLESL